MNLTHAVGEALRGDADPTRRLTLNADTAGGGARKVGCGIMFNDCRGNLQLRSVTVGQLAAALAQVERLLDLVGKGIETPARRPEIDPQIRGILE
jgi:hypothetical protein